MSTELFTPRSYHSVTRDFDSTLSCSSSEASSRLAARLERSEYKRSRAKQRLSNSSRSHSRRKDSRASRKKNSTRETRAKSEEDGVTSVWEVYRQNPYFYSDRMTNGSVNDKREHRNTWYGMPSSSNKPSKRRPQSIHIGCSNYNNSEYQPWKSHNHTERNSYDHGNKDFEHNSEGSRHKSKYSSNNSPLYSDKQHFTDIQADYTIDKNGMYLTRSLSSSFSSYVGSSDEKEDSQGIYSAYDVASRSPYESMVSRRYSQSSLSSSNASWHQHQSPAHNYNLRDIPPLLDPLSSKPNQKIQSWKSNQSEIKGEFQPVNESLPPAVAPKPKKFSSSYTIQLHSAKPSEIPYQCIHTNSMSMSKAADQIDGKGSTVREMARKFTPTSVRHISSSVYNTKIEDRIVSLERSPSLEKAYNENCKRGTDNKNKTGVIMREKEASTKNPEELASHRLSLQELIQLHEEQIAIQAKSAKTNLTHVYLRRSPESSPSKFSDFDNRKGTIHHDFADQIELKTEKLRDGSTKVSTPSTQQEHADYEVREVVRSQSSPFKVIELTDKASGTPRGRTRLKRHRTIGIVGYRHQIDRTAEENIETKLKRHTTVGIVSDFTASREALVKEKKPAKQENQISSPSQNADINGIISNDSQITQENKKKAIPVKIFDIESNSKEDKIQQDEMLCDDVVPLEKQQMESSHGEWLFDDNDKKHFNKPSHEEEFLVDNQESLEKASGSTSSITLREPQQDLVHTRSTIPVQHSTVISDSPSRNSPTVQLLPEIKGSPSVYYKNSPNNYSYSHSKDIQSDTITSNFENLTISKNHLVPVAQVSPVSHCLVSQEVTEEKSMQLSSPPPPSAHEMYQTRLALWDLLPHKSSSDLSEHQSNEGHFSYGENSKYSNYSKEKIPVKFVGHGGQESRFPLHFEEMDKTEDYYLNVIEKLKAENQRLKEKNESEKREFKRMYEEQKKVANAYQKLEDRYRRRVHELQDALASCTCQGSLMIKDSNPKSSHSNHGKEKENQTFKLQSSKSGMRMFEELEEWLSEQSKNSKAPKINAASRDSLISSSSDLTGPGWDEQYMSGGDIDEVNGTHV